MTDKRSKPRPGLDEQRRIVVRAAVRLFSEEGTAAVTISRICKAADVSRPTFYRCFPDKEALLEHVYRVAVDTPVQLNLAEVVDAGKDPRSALDSMVDRLFEQPELAAFVFVQAADQRSPAFAIVQAAFERSAERIEAAYADRGATPPSRTALKATMAACQWIVHDAIRQGLTPEVRADAKQAMAEVVRGMFRTERAHS